jgi:hypothetical protein
MHSNGKRSQAGSQNLRQGLQVQRGYAQVRISFKSPKAAGLHVPGTTLCGFGRLPSLQSVQPRQPSGHQAVPVPS